VDVHSEVMTAFLYMNTLLTTSKDHVWLDLQPIDELHDTLVSGGSIFHGAVGCSSTLFIMVVQKSTK